MPQEEERRELEFKDIVKLTNRDIQLILREVSGKDIALALKGTDEDLRDRVFANVSKRVATMIRDEMILAAAAKMHDVLEMRSVITAIARGLASADAITWPPAARPVQPVEEPRHDRPQVPRPARQKKRRSVRRTVFQAAGGLVSAALLIFLAVLAGRLSQPAAPGKEKVTERKRPTSAGKAQTSAAVTPATAQTPAAAQDPAAGGAAATTEGQSGEATAALPDAASDGAKGVDQGPAKPNGGEVSGASGGSNAGSDSQALKPGDRVETTGDSPAVYQLAEGAGKLEVEPNTSLEVSTGSEDEEAEKQPPRLDLRLGNVMVDVTDPTLEVTSPLARVTATEGSRYRIRVVLDATTTITVESGVVWLNPTVGAQGMVVLQPGDEARISPAGSVSVRQRR